MPPGPIFFNHYTIWIEMIYALVVLVSCWLIYARTREMYELTSHNGIKYFRNTFLFFGITYAVRFFMHLFMTFRINPRLFEHIAFGIRDFSFFIMIYASCMATIYLTYSIFWKKLEKYEFSNVYIFHMAAIIIALISLLRNSPGVFLSFQSVLFLLLIIISFINYRKTRHKGSFSQLYLLYLLIFGLWIISNIIEFIIIFSTLIGLIIYGISVLLFIILLIKVLKKLKNKR